MKRIVSDQQDPSLPQAANERPQHDVAERTCRGRKLWTRSFNPREICVAVLSGSKERGSDERIYLLDEWTDRPPGRKHERSEAGLRENPDEAPFAPNEVLDQSGFVVEERRLD